MVKTQSIAKLTRVAALSTALVLPFAAGAYAQAGENDAFGSQQQAQILQAAQAPATQATLNGAERNALNHEFKVGQNIDFGSTVSPQPGTAGTSFAALQAYQIAEAGPAQGHPADLVGTGGQQDTLANQIYQPGSRPAGW